MKHFFISLFFLVSTAIQAQVVDNMAIYRTINSDRYVRIHYENDYFSLTDEYYTQGINIEFVNPLLAKSPLSKILLGSKNKPTKYGIAVESLGYTPTSTGHDEILYGDRPFAGVLFLKSFAILNDSVHHYRITSALSIGVIGPSAGTEEMQKAIHKWIGDLSPQGWDHQVHEDVVLNYQADYEHQLLAYKNAFCMTGKAGGQIGTLTDKLYGSTTFMAGFFDNPFQTFSKRKHGFQVYLYDEPQFSVIGYDASLEGGVFNRSSPYTIAAGDIKRAVFQNNFGIVFKIKGIYAEYFQSFLSKEFATGGTHRWGGIRIGVAF